MISTKSAILPSQKNRDGLISKERKQVSTIPRPTSCNRDGYTCQNCKMSKTPLHVHHIRFVSEGGSDMPDNLITLCESCHENLHQGKLGEKISDKLRKKASSPTRSATIMNVLKSQLKKSTKLALQRNIWV